MNQQTNSISRLGLLACLLSGLTACDDGDVDNTINFSVNDVVQRGTVHSLDLPGGSVQSLPENAPEQEAEKVELGRLLFWDPVLSGNQDMACATCHLPNRGYTDDLDLSIGVGGVGQGNARVLGHAGFTERNAQTILNTVFNGIDENGAFDQATAPMFWDSREKSLEEQALDPIESQVEMRGDAIAEGDIIPTVMARLNSNSKYLALFQQAYGTDSIEGEQVLDAIATFERTLVANNSPFDRWMRGDASAMTNNQLVGMREFTVNNCIACHSGPMFSDFELHVLGVAENSKNSTPDTGDGNFAFRTPSLRNLGLTAPYMHNGRFSTLRETVQFYDEPASENPNVPNSALDPDFTSIGEIEGERLDRLVDFLNSLNDDQFDKKQPETVPSGLKPGGNI
ncbi:MAG: cytochrome-c peroxidase [Thiolinea sp.]